MTPSETTRCMTLHAFHYRLAITMENRGPVNFTTLLISAVIRARGKVFVGTHCYSISSQRQTLNYLSTLPLSQKRSRLSTEEGKDFETRSGFATNDYSLKTTTFKSVTICPYFRYERVQPWSESV